MILTPEELEEALDQAKHEILSSSSHGEIQGLLVLGIFADGTMWRNYCYTKSLTMIGALEGLKHQIICQREEAMDEAERFLDEPTSPGAS